MTASNHPMPDPQAASFFGPKHGHPSRFTAILCSSMIASALLLSTNSKASAEPISWMEDFALAIDREAKLAELIPGSDDYYYYHCLHYQTTGQLDRSEAMIRDWLSVHKGRETPAITAMIDRQRLLQYRETPQRTIDHLIARLGIKLDHAPPATRNERRFPSELDPALLGVERVVNDALRRNDTLKPLAIQYLAERFLNDDSAGIPINLSDLLQRVSGAYVASLDQLVIAELKSRRPNDQRFGDRAAHAFLTVKQLQTVADRLPKIAHDNAFVAAMLARMRPGADSDPSSQQAVRLDYLRRSESYIRSLPPSYNSLKAAVTYRLLEANLRQGNFNRELFLSYLQLPRISQIVPAEWARKGGLRANPKQDFMAMAMLPPIGNEEPLVRTYLEHFLRDAKNTNDFAQLLQPKYLERVFAETKLLAGVGDPEQWYKMLDAAQRQAIRDRIELQLAAQNPSHFSTKEPTKLLVDVKNVPELVVRIYELNTLSYYRTNERRIDTDIDLDGLVATHEKTLTFNSPAVERHRESIDLPEIEGRGVWIVDLVGEGLRARAMIRRGAIDHVDSFNADGMVFTVIDEERKPIPSATMWVGAREFVADDQGRIVLPPVVDVISRRAILSDGEIAEQLTFEHLQEQYRLEAGIHVDLTQLQSSGKTELLVRPRLMIGRTPIDPGLLEDVSVRIEAEDLDGLPITHQIDGLELQQNAELVVPIRVPPRLASLHVIVSGTITGLADDREQRLQVDQSWDVGGIRRTSQVHDALLTCDGDDFVIEVRGRNGELVPGGIAQISLTTNLCQRPMDVTMQADQRGRIRLGKLEEVTQIRYSTASGLSHQKDLRLNLVRWPKSIHTTTTQPIQLPLTDPQIEPAQGFRLLEIREGNYVSDQTDRLTARDGLLSLGLLPAGDYHLLDRSTAEVTTVAVIDGVEMQRVAVGRVRHRSMSPAVPLALASIVRDGDGLRIQLAGQTDTARVHLYGSRYLDADVPMRELDLPNPALRGRRVRRQASGYVSGLRLGDEYQYVLGRRYADKYPGVMLPQPGIILNPWETEETTNRSQAARVGDAPAPSAAAAMNDAFAGGQSEKRGGFETGSSDFDFVADPGVILANLVPDQNGVVIVPLEIIQGLPILQVVACDAMTVLQRTLTNELDEMETNDLRLGKSLDASKSLSLERAVTVASPDQPLDLNSLGSAQIQIYASVSDLFKLYKTMVNDARMNDFDPLSVWGSLGQEEKLDAYSRLAGHELHLFLWFHDRPFFKDFIRPYLENKKEKQFIDHFLLESDLTPFTELWKYNQLNAAERALLAMRLPEFRDGILRELRETIESRPTDPERIRAGVEIALRGKSLDLGMNDALAAELGDFEEAPMSEALESKMQQSPGSNLARKRRGLAEAAERFESKAVEHLFFGRAAGGMSMGGGSFYRDLDSTKQWAESQWDRVRTVGGPSPATRISVNRFWSSVAGYDPSAMKISNHLLRPTENRHAALVALAMSGLPLSAGEVGLPTAGEPNYRPEHGVAVVTRRLRELEPSIDASSILIGQRFQKLDNVDKETQGSKPISEPTEFLPGEAYRGQVVVSNPTAQQRMVEIFWQIPSGSLPLAANQTTDSRSVTLKPFAVQSIDYQFYFPAAGEFTHYPATVSSDGKLVAKAELKTFKVVEQLSDSGGIRWEVLAQSGTAEQISAFLQQANLQEIDWIRIAHRMKDQEIYQVVIKTLRQARLPILDLWAYGLTHRDEQAIAVYLSLRDDLVGRIGPVLRSPLLDVDPLERRWHEVLEYAPLVRARIHRLGQKDQILNPTFRTQYEAFLRILAYDDQIAPDDHLLLAYYLLIQNRISEAIDQFGQADRAKVDAQLQYDYLDAYLKMHQGQYDQAEQIASRHQPHPIPRWQARFGQMLSQLQQRRDLNLTESLVSADKQDASDSLAEGSGDLAVMDRERRQGAASIEQPEVIARVEGDVVRIDHRNTKEADVNYYGVDLELLFSKAPFVREDLQRMAMVRPARTEPVRFENLTGVEQVKLDDNLRRQTLLVEVIAGASRSTALYYGGDLTTYVSESFGQLQTTDMRTSRPLEGAYVKVYAKYPNGDVRFYKDGYTDLRGRFDYASVSAADAKGAIRFAILVNSPEKGATIHDVAVPNR